MDQTIGPRRYRTVFLSDIHLGARECQAELLLDFLRHMSCERLYLIGDIVDGWKLRRGWHWPQAHNDVVQKLLRLARKGARVTYVPGNHDDRVRDFCGVHFGGVEVAREAVHETADGRRLLVVHGDEFDGLVRGAAWRSIAGDLAYKAVIALNTLIAGARRRLGLSYWSLSAALKGSLARARAFVETFEESAAAEAARRGLDGVVCGHIHRAALREVGGVTYANDGDWVESCTALVEHMDGRLEIVDWAALRARYMIRSTPHSLEELIEPAPA
ncbi:MAG TPA: UDP-2,3-diacylglucosamine diphosphatase [Caulobacteraceae bacterium]|jgi:UDP-2,3-diacylglucosamine pyrophosphatase LpxH|nr:UDP-2,3-diacylglucosamine diphosphatase [Caulobacteraceae bacterium]